MIDYVGKNQLNNLSRCPHCNIHNPNITKIKDVLPFTILPYNMNTIRAIYQCGSCDNLILAKGAAKGSSQAPIQEILPPPRLPHPSLPEKVRTYLQQAMDTLTSPDASTVMSASAVDAMLKELDYEKGDIKTRLELAVSDGKLTQGMADWANHVRLEANNVRHADVNRPHLSKQDAENCLNFAEALGEFLFALPSKISVGIANQRCPTA